MEKQGEAYLCEDVEPELVEELKRHYSSKALKPLRVPNRLRALEAISGFVRVGPKGYFFPSKYKENAVAFYNMPIRSDDIVINTFPRSGTTWAQELIWLLQNNLDFEKARITPLLYRFPFLEFGLFVQPTHEKQIFENYKYNKEMLKAMERINKPGVDRIAEIPSPRFIKSHLPLSLLPPCLLDTAKVIYVARDPRDVAVSLYHFSKRHICHGAPESFKTFWNLFVKGQVFFGPIFAHVKEAWNQRNHPNMLFIFYEELHKDLPAAVRKVAAFLEKEYTEEQVQQLCDHLSFEKIKNNSSVNRSMIQEVNLRSDFYLVRKGKVGGWREYFDEDMMEQADKWFEENLRDTDLQYPTYTVNDKEDSG